MSGSYYEDLGVARDASADDIKRAYRRLARDLHPDRNPDDANAAERFKRVTEAYAALSDPEKKKLYDQFGPDGLRDGFDPDRMRGFHGGGGPGGPGGFGFDFDFADLFGGGVGGRGAPVDVEAEQTISLEQAAAGFATTFRFGRRQPCGACGGRRVVAQRPCSACRGSGVTESPASVTVNVPRGADSGDRIRLKGQGHRRANGAPGDLVLTITVRPHELLRREGLNLVSPVTISPVDAILGASVEVRGLDGTLRVTVPPRVGSGTRLRLAGKGLTRKAKTGDLIAELTVAPLDVPVDGEVREAAERLRDAVAAAHRSPVEPGGDPVAGA
ncbi:MAG: J domain-containing protein [Myxococcales bacterium]|nr:J domain-containing protein [Myxococcales bacterium]MCB9520693.1 J domain-containing protein [Myxococcales bacterium]